MVAANIGDNELLGEVSPVIFTLQVCEILESYLDCMQEDKRIWVI